jgi:hypothetical protein
MKHIEPFSKEMYSGDTVSNDEDGCRAGFLEHVKITKCPDREPRRGLADFQTQDPDTKAQGNPAHPEFKERSDDGLRSFPAPFSRTKLSGEPKRTPGH